MVQTDVLVIGGGATGAGIARDLARRGIDTLLVERGDVASGTTGRSHALLHSGGRYAENDPDGVAECIEENRILRDIAPHCIQDTGGLFLQTAADDPEYLSQKHTACEDIGIPVEPVDGEQVQQSLPVADDIQRAFHVPDAVIDPFRLTVANLVDAIDHGAQVEPRTAVTDLHGDGGEVSGATIRHDADETRISADHVVNAAGAWAGSVAAMADVSIGMQPTAGVMAVVENPGIDTVLNRCRPPDDGDIIVPHGDVAVPGTTSTAVDDPDSFSRPGAAVQQVIDEAADMVPALQDAAVLDTYWGVRPLYRPSTEGNEGRDISRGFHLLDHAERDGVDRFTTIVGGKLTTYRAMAEAVADHVAATLGVASPTTTHDEPLPGDDDPSTLSPYLDRFGPRPPASFQ
ncbi:MAG: FAD-dependent oxidoreductase [Candidatus Nanohaloarchaea archaeon]|nr:FAD-dependent oxidoreductase [Candidatus Nanohaloarchaea archaeon]